MTGAQAEVVIAKVKALKAIRLTLWDASENLTTLQRRELNTAADCLSAVINDLEARL